MPWSTRYLYVYISTLSRGHNVVVPIQDRMVAKLFFLLRTSPCPLDAFSSTRVYTVSLALGKLSRLAQSVYVYAYAASV